MKQMSDSSEIKVAYGQPVIPNLPYKWEWENYEGFGELVAAKDELTNDEQVKARNDAREAKARQESWTNALKAAGIEKPSIENNEKVRSAGMVKILKAAGLDNEAIKEEVKRLLKIDLTDADLT